MADFKPGEAGDPAFDANPRDFMAQRDGTQWLNRLRGVAQPLNFGDWEQAAKDEYQGVDSWVRDAANAGKDPEEALKAAEARLRARGAGGAAGGSSNDNGGGGNPNASSQASNNFSVPSWYTDAMKGQTDLLSKMYADQQARQAQIASDEAANGVKRDSLYSTLLDRSQQGLAIDPSNPIIKGQTDAYKAMQDRASRNYLSDVAEQSGPIANLRGEQRMASEKVGTATSNFQAQLLANELTSRRQEVADALNSMRGILTTDQQANLQREINSYDQQLNQVKTSMSGIQDQGMLGYNYANLGSQSQLGNRGLDNQLLSALMGNSQFYAGLGSKDDQFYNDWILRNADQTAKWDWMNKNGSNA